MLRIKELLPHPSNTGPHKALKGAFIKPLNADQEETGGWASLGNPLQGVNQFYKVCQSSGGITASQVEINGL